MSRGNNREIPFVGVVSVIATGLYPCQLLVCNQLRRQLKVLYSQGCPNVSLSHQPATGATKHATSQKHCLTQEILAKHDQLSLLYISLELFLIQIVFKKSE